MAEPVIIIGAGPAGLSCASTLVRSGRDVVLIDDNAQSGGQYFRQLPVGYAARPDARLMRDRTRYLALQEVISHPRLRYMPRTTVWASPAPLTVAYAGAAESGRIRGAAVVIATGAQEKSMPFPGWTMPGVISAGGSLNLAKAHGLVPEGRVVVVGNGPLVLVAAATLAVAGATVTDVVEAQETPRLAMAAISGLISAPKILATAAKYRGQILRVGARYCAGWMVCEAHGGPTLEAVTIARVGKDGCPDPARRRTIPADLLVLGYGILPGAEAARLLGCEMALQPELGGLVPSRSARFETSVSGVYAIGDGAGIGGVETSLLEGELAALSILGEGQPQARRRAYDGIDRFRRKLNLAYRIGPELTAATRDTIICRCEELRLGDLADDPNTGRGNLTGIKTSSRLGMGRCQGRNCLHSAAGLLEFTPETALATAPRVRPPLRPVPLAQLAADRDAGPAREPDEINLSETKD